MSSPYSTTKGCKTTTKALNFSASVTWEHNGRPHTAMKRTGGSTGALTWNVRDHGEDEEGVVVKGEVVLVGQSDRVQACLLYDGQCSVDGQ